VIIGILVLPEGVVIYAALRPTDTIKGAALRCKALSMAAARA
jgi:hypothetical protein